MLNKEEILKVINDFVQQKFPEITENFEIGLRAVDSADINSDHVKNLVNAIYFTFLQRDIHSTTKLYILVREFAYAFKEMAAVQKLDELWEGKQKGNYYLPVPTIEVIVLRDISQPGFRIRKNYNYGGQGQVYYLGDLNWRNQVVRREVMHVFYTIYLGHDIHESFDMPSFEGAHEGMPNL